MNVMQGFAIRSGQGDYEVAFPADLEALVGELDRGPALVVADRRVLDRYGEALAPALGRRAVHAVDANEDEKTLEGVGRLLSFLQREGATKQTRLIAIGGGIVQDLVAFSSHVYYRGLRWTFAPTTLLAMCDSCIGAKCGINLGAFKNQLGVFHAPSRVLVCSSFLDTLPDADVRSGYGEILKLLLTGPRSQFEALVEVVDAQGFRNARLMELVRESLLVKKEVIESDEYERDLRRILNYGHTFGHALEAITEHEIPHGAAVAWGCDLANYLARERGLLSPEDYALVHAFIARHFAVRLTRALDADALIAAARRDKKVADGKLVLVLPRAPGRLEIVPVDFDERLRADVATYLERESVVRGG